MDQCGRALGRNAARQQAAQLSSSSGQLLRRALHQPRPSHHLGLEAHRFLAADSGAVERQGLQFLEHLHSGLGDVERPLLFSGLFDAHTLDRLHEHEWPPVYDRIGGQDWDRGGGQAGIVKGGHDAALADDISRTGDPRAGRGEAQDVTTRAIAIFDGHEVREPGMALRDGVDRGHVQSRPAEPLTALRLEVFANAFAHSR